MYKTLLKIIAIIFVVLPAAASAATAVVKIDTGEESINALEGILILPENVNTHTIQNGNSALLMWIAKPTQVDNKITFAGITPGGFSGIFPIFIMKGEFSAHDLAQIKFESITALSDDGSGTRVPVKMEASFFEPKNDSTPPENFTPVILQNENIFDGKYFLVFATQDKGSGVAQYKVREGSWGWVKDLESPYLLKNQRLDQFIYVKAIDSAGNVRIAEIPPTNSPRWYKQVFYWLILIGMGLGALYALKKQWQNQK